MKKTLTSSNGVMQTADRCMTYEEIIDEMANREARRVNILLLLKRKYEGSDTDYIMDELRPIYKDIERDVYHKRKDPYFSLMRALIYVFMFGEIYGVRKERARRAKCSHR